MTVNLDDFRSSARRFGGEVFSTFEFIDAFSEDFPVQWLNIVEKYGVGGQGAGRHYTANSYIAQRLSQLVRSYFLNRHKYEQSPPGWGSHVIRFWSVTGGTGKARKAPKQVVIPAWADMEFREGGKVLRSHLRSERHPSLPAAKKAHFRRINGGRIFCEMCDFNPQGDVVKEAAIEVHHATKNVGSMHPAEVTKLTDLKCLCANCHRMVHAEQRQRTKNNPIAA